MISRGTSVSFQVRQRRVTRAESPLEPVPDVDDVVAGGLGVVVARLRRLLGLHRTRRQRGRTQQRAGA
jgi:hypothetical protein